MAPTEVTRPAASRSPWWSHLYVQVLIAIALGVALGYFRPDLAGSDLVKALGDGFVKLIKMIIRSIIFCTVVAGIAGMESMKRSARRTDAIIYFEVVRPWRSSSGSSWSTCCNGRRRQHRSEDHRPLQDRDLHRRRP